jgi:[acyl-carrier-protein] S-malonyltransferase
MRAIALEPTHVHITMTTRFAFVFPGQGSQAIGMLGTLAAAYPSVRRTFEEASDILGEDLWALTQEGPAEQLNLTRNTQPAMLVAGVAVWRVWSEQGGRSPARMAGHSLGEYTALVCGDALSFPETVMLVLERARLMQEAVPEGEGAMAAVLGLDDATILEICAKTSAEGVVEPVNFNSPGQVVIAGRRHAVARAAEAAKQAGARRALSLPVSVPAHSSLMRPAAKALAPYLAAARVQTPSIEVIHNATAGPCTDPDEIRNLLVRQIHSPVRWVETIQAMADAGVTTVIEAGPGRVLTGLTKRIDPKLNALAMNEPDSLKKAMEIIDES